jgi:hypothetical protein
VNLKIIYIVIKKNKEEVRKIIKLKKRLKKRGVWVKNKNEPCCYRHEVLSSVKYTKSFGYDSTVK